MVTDSNRPNGALTPHGGIAASAEAEAAAADAPVGETALCVLTQVLRKARVMALRMGYCMVIFEEANIFEEEGCRIMRGGKQDFLIQRNQRNRCRSEPRAIELAGGVAISFIP